MSFEDFTSTGPLAMTKESAKAIFDEKYDTICNNGSPPENPTLYLVCGTPGSGKSTAIRKGLEELAGATCTIEPDKFAAWIPGYQNYAKKYPSTALEAAENAGSNYFAKEAQKRARSSNLNVILETADPSYVAKVAVLFKDEGYENLVLHFVAASRQASWTSVMERTKQALDEGNIGTNAIVEKVEHDKSYAGWPRVIFDAERDLPISELIISRRNGEIAYRNLFGPTEAPDEDKAWEKPPHGVFAAFRLRHEPITEEIANTHDAAWNRIVKIKHMDNVDEGLKGLPLEQYRSEIIAFDRNEMSRVDLKDQARKFSLTAINKWYHHVIADLNAAGSSEQYLGPSEEFVKCIRLYGSETTNNVRKYAIANGLIREPITQPPTEQPIIEASLSAKRRQTDELGTAKKRALSESDDETSKRPKLTRGLDERNPEGRGRGGRA